MPIILASGGILKHACGLTFKNVRRESVSFPDDKCPQCGAKLQQGNVGSAVQETTTLILVPPHGMSFKNTMGSEVQITMPRGMEMDLFHEMERQLHQWIAQFSSGKASGGDAFNKNRLLAAGREALAKKISIDDDGNIVFGSDETVTTEDKPST